MPDDWPSLSRRHIRDELTRGQDDLRVGTEAKRMAAWEAVGFWNLLGRVAEAYMEADPDTTKTLKDRHIQKASDAINRALDDLEGP